MTWLRYAILLIAAVRIGFVIARLRRAPKSWTQAILPAMILCFAPSGSYAIRLIIVETLAFGIAGYAIADFVRNRVPHTLPEDRIAAALSRFFPAFASRWIAAEMIILYYAFYGVFHLFRIPPGPGFGYAAEATIRYLPLIFVVAGPPEVLVLDAVIPVRLALLRLCLHILEVWAFLWIYGLYVSMRLRPHAIEDGVLRVFKGILGSAAIPVEDIRDVEVNAVIDKGPGRAALTSRGTATATIHLGRPVQVTRLFGTRSINATTVTVSADDPARFREAAMRPSTSISPR
jgi:hypothetical protein